MITLRLLFALFIATMAPALRAQVVDLPYGAPIPLAEAKRVVAAAQAEATKNKWNVAIAVVDVGGHLVAFERMDHHATWQRGCGAGKGADGRRISPSVQGISGHGRGWWRRVADVAFARRAAD
jgi:hypothetical protein